MSCQIYYRAMVMPTVNGKFLFISEDGSSNCWQVGLSGNWIRERMWHIHNREYANAQECIEDYAKEVETGDIRAVRGEFANFIKRAFKRVVSREQLQATMPTFVWVERNEIGQICHKSYSMTESEPINTDLLNRGQVFLNPFFTDVLYKDPQSSLLRHVTTSLKNCEHA